MSWTIVEMENTVKVSKKVAKELFDAQEYEEEIWYEASEVVGKGDRLVFNRNHAEHMDYLDNESIQKILKKNRVKGRVCFGSLEGGIADSFWGYEFDGLGGMVELRGGITWKAI